jgi:hypothetical protein
MRDSFRNQRLCGIVILTVAALISASCGQPVLESEACLESRDSLRKVYSIHLDGGANPTGAGLERLRKFLSKDLFEELSKYNTKAGDDVKDLMTQNKEFPRAFRAGTCRDTDAGTEFEVLLLWRDDETNTERKILVTMQKADEWLVTKVREPENNGR